MSRLQSISLGTRIGIAVFLLALSLSGSAGIFYYYSTHDFVITQMGGRLLDLGRTGGYLFDQKDRESIVALTARIERLRAPLSPADLQLGPEDTLDTLTPAQAEEIMAGEDFQRLVQRLRQVRDGSRRRVSPLRHIPQLAEDQSDVPLIKYAYLLVGIPESPDHSITKYLADADFEDVDENGDGIIDEDEYGTPIGTLWQTPLEEFQRAFDGEAVAAN